MQGDSEVLLSRWLVLFVSSRRHLSRLSGCHNDSGSDPRVQASLLNRKCPACRSCIVGKGLRKITFVRLESSDRGESTGWSRGSDWSQLSSIHITYSCKASRHRPPPPPNQQLSSLYTQTPVCEGAPSCPTTDSTCAILLWPRPHIGFRAFKVTRAGEVCFRVFYTSLSGEHIDKEGAHLLGQIYT